MCLSLVPMQPFWMLQAISLSFRGPRGLCNRRGNLCKGQETQPVGQATRASFDQTIQTCLFLSVQYWVKVPPTDVVPADRCVMPGNCLAKERGSWGAEASSRWCSRIFPYFLWQLLTGLRMGVLCWCGPHPACWRPLIERRSKYQMGRKTPPVDAGPSLSLSWHIAAVCLLFRSLSSEGILFRKHQ